MRGLVIVAAMLAAPAAAASDQFDLICAGQYKDHLMAKPAPVERRFRVDLARGEWCSGPCGSVSAFASVTTGTLIMAKAERRLPSDTEKIVRVDRSTGEWYEFEDVRRPYRLVAWSKGTCQRAPFTGLPAPKF